ncbi:HNH endonuclease [Nocardioides pakistanensis]
MTQVIILNASYERLGATSVKHAINMLVRKVAEVEEHEEGRSIGPYPWPRVLRLVRYVAAKWLHRPAACTKSGVLRRDRRRCAYCGKRGETIDHVVPQAMGGPNTWANLVTACSPCNNRKDCRTPEQAGMPLRYRPWTPTLAQLLAMS